MVLNSNERFSDPEAEAEIGWVVDLVRHSLGARRDNIPPATLTPLVLAAASTETKGAGAALERCHQAPVAACRHLLRGYRPEGTVQLLVRGEVAACRSRA